MTDQLDKTIVEPGGDAEPQSAVTAPGLINRRTMLRGATATLPTILTLTSGAALAASSNLIRTVQSTSGDVLCLQPGSTQTPNGLTPQNPNVYDLGSPPYGEVTRFPTANRYRDGSTSTDVSAQEACRLNGTLQVKYGGSGPWNDKTRTAGVMVSNAAVTSFGARIITTDI